MLAPIAALAATVALLSSTPDARRPPARALSPTANETAATPLPPPGQSDPRGEVHEIDLAATPFTITRAARAFAPAGATSGILTVELEGGLADRTDKLGELVFDLSRASIANRPWGDRAHLSAEVRVAPAFVGEGVRNWQRPHRAALFLIDARGRRLHLPHVLIVDRPDASDGWLRLEGRPTVTVPIPLGLAEPGFNPSAVRKVGLVVEAFNREGERVSGAIELRSLQVAFGPRARADLLRADPRIRAGETARAARMNERLAQRCGVGAGEMAVGVNLAWPTARSPEGTDLQLYGRILDAGAPWWDALWDLGHPEVAASVRRDFGEIRALFGAGAVVRLWLFGDLRAGITFAPDGTPIETTARARANMRALLDLAAAERVVLVPTLLDFGMADGRARSGPDGRWPVGEHLDLVVDARKRAALVSVMEAFVRPFAADPAILAWDVMNEPENAVAAVTPERFGALQTLLRDLVDAVHRAGDLATIGHRNAHEPGPFFRGRVATDLGQPHFYPTLETRTNPSPFGRRMGPIFGPIPAGWGELQATPGAIAAQIETARRAGHRLFLLWSWRGEQEAGDGFAVRPYADEIRRALGR